MFEDPFIERGVPLFANVARGGALTREQIDSIDIAKVIVRNVPHDLDTGRAVKDAWASVTLYDAKTRQKVLNFDHPRWDENPKPGYEGNPTTYFPSEWNRRELSANLEGNTISFCLKNQAEAEMYGYRGRSQIKPGWRDKGLCLPAGEYLARLQISGAGLQEPARLWMRVSNRGVGRGLEVERTAERVGTALFWRKRSAAPGA